MYGFLEMTLEICVYLSKALHPFVGPWPLLQFLDLLHGRWNPLEGGSACHEAATCTQDSANTE
jgi:hypothetical protein